MLKFVGKRVDFEKFSQKIQQLPMPAHTLSSIFENPKKIIDEKRSPKYSFSSYLLTQGFMRAATITERLLWRWRTRKHVYPHWHRKNG